MSVVKPSFCIIYDLQAERDKRYGLYSRMSMPFLLESMTNFLEANPMPISSKGTLKEGIAIFEQVYKKAHTEELRKIAGDYLKLYQNTYA